MGINTELMTVSPKVASELLESRNGVNRPLRRAHVVALAEAMRRGEWRVTHQGLALTSSGHLLDGQHRLAAIIEYGKPIRMMVSTGVPKDAFDVLDVGAKRTAGDMVSLAGLSHGNQMAATARLVIFYDLLSDKVWHGVEINKEISTHRVVEFSVENGPALYAAIQLALPVRQIVKMNMSALSTAAYLIDRVAPESEQAAEFFGRLASGESLGRGDPRLTLRNMYIGGRPDRRSMDRQYQLAVILKAWNAFVEGRQVKMFKWNPGENMPVVVAPS